ncbi:MAG: AAA family ATPase, partial [archaeon]
MFLGIVGLNGSGKDTVAQYLVQKHNFVHEDFGQEIRDELKTLGKNYLDRIEMINLANERRAKFGHNYWAIRLLTKHPE